MARVYFSLKTRKSIEFERGKKGNHSRASFATGGSASANPAGVQQPGICLMLRDFLCEHFCIAHWVKSEEGLRKAGGKRRLGFCDTIFGSGHLGGVARYEVEHRLFGG